MNLKVTLLPGDGIGPEVTEAAVKVMQHTADKYDIQLELREELFGGCAYDKHGTPLTEQTLAACRESNAVFLGAVGGNQWDGLPQHLKPEAGLLKLRHELGLYANVRPARVFSSFVQSSSLKNEVVRDVDFVVMRELTGGIYFGAPRGVEADKGWNTMSYERHEVERIARKAFELARDRRGRVTSVDKANVLEVSQFWRNIVREVSRDYPSVALSHMYVDNAAMQIVRDPKQFDVILTSNLFGDILSDIAGMITGSLGMLPSASIGHSHALFEPVHGSAPDIAGKNIANPIAAISSVGMMFEHLFQMSKAAQVIERAIDNTLQQGYRTADIARPGDRVLSTTEMTSHILEQCEDLYNTEAIRVFTL